MGKTINATIAEQNLIIEPSVISVAESVNVYSLKIAYDAEWAGIDAKIVTFSGTNGQSFAIQDNGKENGVTIPWEVLQCPGKVSVGVVGYKGSEVKLTTTGLYDRNTFVVLPEAFGLKSAMTPTPDIYQKLLETINEFNQGLVETNAKIGDLNNLETEAKNNLVAAINEVLNGGGGEGTVKSVNQKEPDAEGNVELSAGDVGAATAESVEGLATTVATKQDALTQTQLAAVNSGINSTKVGQIATNASDIDTINGKIPAQASASNQLADKGFVNSSIQTQTAHFRGNWENWTNVPTDATEYPVDDDGNHEPTTNDYMVVQDASGFPVGQGEPTLEGTWRFKYSGTWTTNGKNGWLPEYQVNETPLTSAQLAALNSGITDTAVEKLNGIEAGAEVNEIDSISVNGAAVTPDANKNVDLTIDEGIKTLTTADYNYPVDNPIYIDGQLLPKGIYLIGEPLLFLRSRADASVITLSGGLLIKLTEPNANFTEIFPKYLYTGSLNNASGSGTLVFWTSNIIPGQTILRQTDVVNSLTSTEVRSPLSANQGRILNERIGDLSTLTATDKTSAVAAINEVNTKAVGTTETLTIATNDWAALSSSDPYDYSTTVSVTATIGANPTVELLNDQAVLFSTYGFAIGAVDTTNNTVTIYSIGQPDASVSLKLNIRNL